ncbi:MAG: ABC transporter ATP-binding protein [Spirochaetaceae bacterium]|jgi:iron complex transport system ATP-binding protein|nr:ABC transporter ATP-binding protein [Spirochaetaceae bacterium]
MNSALLEASALSFSYDRKRMVFQNLSLVLKKGEIYTLLGGNGAGKSTLLSCLRGFLRAESGRVFAEGKNILDLTRQDRARIIGFIPQSVVGSSLSARDYIVLGRSPWMGFFALPGKREYERADEVMESLGIPDLGEKPCDTLSGGQMRQVQIARSLVQEPKLLLMDEPANHLDFGNQIKVLKMIHALSRKGIGVLLTTHNPDQAILLGGRTGILDESGRLVSGTSEDVINEENLTRIYREKICIPFVSALSRRVCAAGAIT